MCMHSLWLTGWTVLHTQSMLNPTHGRSRHRPSFTQKAMFCLSLEQTHTQTHTPTLTGALLQSLQFFAQFLHLCTAAMKVPRHR